MSDFTAVPILLFALFFVIIIIAGIANAKQARLREQELIALANRRGLTYLPNGLEMSGQGWSLFGSYQPSRPVAEFTQWFPLFDKGSSRNIELALVGPDSKGSHWSLFDYKYEEKSDDSTTTYRYGVIVAQVPFNLPRMILSEESAFNSIGKIFGSRELQVESEEFNRRYFIQTDDDKMALDILHPTAIETLLNQPVLEWQMTGPFIMLHLRGTLSASDYEGLMGCLVHFLDKIPNYYRQDYAV